VPGFCTRVDERSRKRKQEDKQKPDRVIIESVNTPGAHVHSGRTNASRKRAATPKVLPTAAPGLTQGQMRVAIS
jgi:hypothetical protein